MDEMMRLSARPAAAGKEERTGNGGTGSARGWTIDSHAEMAKALRARSGTLVQRMYQPDTTSDDDDDSDEDDDESGLLPDAAMAVLEKEVVPVETRATRGNKGGAEINIADFVRQIAGGKKDVLRAAVVVALKERIKSVAQEQSPDPERLAGLQWAVDYLAFPARSRSGSGGSDDLEVTPEGNLLSVRGRPRFLPAAIELPNMQKGFARRHMIAWHTIRQAITNLINAILRKDPGDPRLQQLRTEIEAEAPPEQQKEGEENKPFRGKKKKKPEKPAVTDLEKLSVAVERLLRVMNSNTRNLWPGPGYENSLINSYQSAMRTWRGQLETMSDGQATIWRQTFVDKIDANAKLHRGAYAKTLQSLRDFLADANVTREDLVRELPQLADNFEFDFPFDDDQRRAPKLDVQLVRIAGRFLDLADKEPESDDASNLQSELLTLVRQFLGSEQIVKTTNSNVDVDPNVVSNAIVITPSTPESKPSSGATGIRPTVIGMLGALLGGGDVDGAALEVYAGEPLQKAIALYRETLAKLAAVIAKTHDDDARELQTLLTNGILPGEATLEEFDEPRSTHPDAFAVADHTLLALRRVVVEAISDNDRSVLDPKAFEPRDDPSLFSPLRKYIGVGRKTNRNEEPSSPFAPRTRTEEKKTELDPNK